MSDHPTDRIEIGKRYEVFSRWSRYKRSYPLDTENHQVANRARSARRGLPVRVWDIQTEADAQALRDYLAERRATAYSATFEPRVRDRRYDQ